MQIALQSHYQISHQVAAGHLFMDGEDNAQGAAYTHPTYPTNVWSLTHNIVGYVATGDDYIVSIGK